MTTLPPGLKLRILGAARAEPSPGRPAVRRRTALLLAASFVGLAVAFFAVGGLRMDGRPMPQVVGTAIGWTAVAALTTWQGFVRGKSMLGRPRGQLLAIVVATPLVLLLWLAWWDTIYPGAGTPCSATHWIPCFVLTLLMATAPFAALTLARRGSDPVHPRITGAALGAAAGAWGAVMIDLRCSVVRLAHVALGHALPLLALAALGAWLGGRVVGMRCSGVETPPR